MKRKTAWLLLSCLVVVAVVLASCGPAEEEEEVPVAEGPQYGGELTYAYGLEASSLDPILGRSGGDAYYWRQMFDHLVGADSELVSQPELSLAESWEFPDDTTMLFHLRKGVKFHDGTDFNADAVKFNIERVLDPEVASTPRASFLVIESVEVVDDYTVKFNLKNPWGAGLGMIADRGGCMNSPAAVDKWGDEYGFNPVGTGPFKLDEYVSGSHAEFVKNEDYWGKDADGNSLPFLDRLTLNYIPDPAVVSAALETGEVDIAGIPSEDIEKFEANPDISLVGFEGSGISSIWNFNRAMPPMDNIYLRKAVAYGVNPEEVVEAVYFGSGIVADAGFWPVGCWVYDNTVPRPYYDPEQAKEFLRLGGHPDGFKVDACTYTPQTQVQQAEMYQAQLAEIGIEVEIHVFDVGTMCNKMWVTEEFPLMWTGWSRYPEPDWIASGAYGSEGYYNPGREHGLPPNPEMDALIAAGASTYDIEERKAIYREINEIVLDECWYVPMVYGIAYVGYWGDRVGGMDTFYGWDAKWLFKQLWLK